MANEKQRTTGPERGELPALPPRAQAKDPSSSMFFWPGMVFGVLLAASVALKCILIFMILSASKVPAEKTNPHEIQSCRQKCIPCRSANSHLTANLTLDPSTAHPQLYVSENLKSVKWRYMKQSVNSSPLRYDLLDSVLSHQGIDSGKFCWEVEVVEGGNWWGVGIVRESANRNGKILLAPEGGYWGVQRIDGQYQSITANPRTNLSLCHPPSRIRVSLDYSEGLVGFFDGDTDAHLFTFPKAKFSGEKVHAWFLIEGWNGELTVHP
ncbi:butyrophilin subfamily 1 member A1-like isoform X1 [Podarcis lilfordi]|uniref:Butyrophilin subfamily 1 member A1-like isoform X1 n=1 Tax=Podarcis lilfordi TaxID=74358 RepID=A0AA35JY07_9SAUR|nr:butyrophilin subfamily 1 member A1-like isoform X1 [Podarcis lilfordi]